MIEAIFGNARDMSEVEDISVGFNLISPLYYNGPFDFP
ncbi:hypothetical protein HS7_12480 [Sulfolobales archaeon HS-7]|nr:hypothetical protein HS7_12480 [Sulfolobales archaeon HS-7]